MLCLFCCFLTALSKIAKQRCMFLSWGDKCIDTTIFYHDAPRCILQRRFTALFTKLPALQFLAIPWFDWSYSIVPPFHPWSSEWGNGLWGSFWPAAFWEQLVTKEPATLWIALLGFKEVIRKIILLLLNAYYYDKLVILLKLIFLYVKFKLRDVCVNVHFFTSWKCPFLSPKITC